MSEPDWDDLIGDGLEDTPPKQIQWLEQAVTAQFELTLDTILASRNGQPWTVGDAIIDRAAELLVQQAGEKTINGYSYYSQVHDAVGERLDGKADDLVAELWQKQVTQTDRFGGGTGEPVSLEAWAADRIEKWLRQGADSYNNRVNRLEKAIEGVLDRKLSKQLDEAIAGARDQALAAVTKVAEEHLTKALRVSIAAVLHENVGD